MAYRFNPFTGTLDDIGTPVAGGPFQPLDAGLTALSSLGAGIAVSDGADGWVARSLAVTDSATVDFTLTNANGTAGNPTITASVIQAALDHGSIGGLTDDDHGHYTLRAGRANTGNDTTLSTNADGTLYGSAASGQDLNLRATSHATQGVITLYDTSELWIGHKSVVAAEEHVLNWDLSFGGVDTTYDTSTAVFAFVNMEGTLDLVANPGAGDFVLFRTVYVQDASLGSTTAFVKGAAIGWQPRHTVRSGVTITDCGTTGLSHEPNYTVEAGGTLGGGIEYGLRTRIVASGNFDLGEWYTTQSRAPVLTGGAVISNFYGNYFESFTTTGDNFCFLNEGGHNFIHNGFMRIGSASRAVSGPIAAGVGLDMHTHLRMRIGKQVRFTPATEVGDFISFVAPDPLVATCNYTWPDNVPTTNGQSLTSTTAGAMSWASMQPLDSDLTAIAALSGTGLLAHTGSGTWAERTLTAPAAGITISNPAGVAGNPTFALANDLSALEGMSGTGLVARTASETYAQRTITAGAGISVSNGDGVSGNPTIAATGIFTPSAAQTIDAASDTISANATVVQVTNTTGANITLTSTPTIADGTDGQLLMIVSVGTNPVTLSDGAANNLNLGNATRQLGTGDTITLLWNANQSNWLELAFTNN